jgi:cytidine deaminase
MTQLTDAEWQQLIQAALEVQQRAYAPYSHFTVGAAILDASGERFTGANVENASYGLTICAERVAACAAVTAEGTAEHAWRGLAIASRGGVPPCGACRQFLMEFAADMQVALVDSSTGQTQHLGAMRLLLPAAFELRLDTPNP